MPMLGLFREHQPALDHHLEDPPLGGNQLDGRLGMFRSDFGRQTDGPGLVVSNGTVFDGNFHRLGTPYANWEVSCLRIVPKPAVRAKGITL